MQQTRKPSSGQNRPPQRQGAGKPMPKKNKPNIAIRAFDYIRTHILLRNLILAVCLVIILIFLVNLSLSLFTRHGQKRIVPDFIGQSLTEAGAAGKKAGDLKLEVIDSLYMPKQQPGVILDQSPKPGTGVKSGRRVFLTINAHRPRMEEIPYVTGYSLRQAKNMLENRGFEISELKYRSDIATNNVLDQLYNGKSIQRGDKVMAELGSGITLVVGVNQSSPLPRIPKVIGLSLREAKSRLWEVGINVGNVKNDSDVTIDNIEHARIYRQEPGQQSRIDYGGKVSLWLTTDPDKLSKSSRDADNAARRMVPDDDEDEEDIDI